MNNDITLNCRLANKPTSRTTDRGDAVCSFDVAWNKQVKEDNGEWVTTQTEFYKITCWGELGEHVMASDWDKGQPVTIITHGAVSAEAYTRKDGTPGVTMKITAQDVHVSLRAAPVRVMRDRVQNVPNAQPVNVTL